LYALTPWFVAPILPPIPPVFPAIAAIFASVAHILAAIEAILDPVAPSAIVARVANVFAAVAAILAAIADVFTPIAAVLTSIENVFHPIAHRRASWPCSLRVGDRNRREHRDNGGGVKESTKHFPSSQFGRAPCAPLFV
jgi:hypothetical protein